MKCNETGWSSGDELPLASANACIAHDATYRWIWVSFCVMELALALHAIPQSPLNAAHQLKKIIKRGGGQHFLFGVFRFCIPHS